MSNIRTLARLLGGVVIDRDSVLCPGPGHSAKDLSLKVTFLADGSFICHSFSGDDWITCREHVRRLLGLGDWRENRRSPENVESFRAMAKASKGEDAARSATALRLWDAAHPPGGTPVETYLRFRGLELTHDLRRGEALRFHPACPFKLVTGKTVHPPAMVGLFRDIRTDQPKGVHRTALAADGCGKADIPGLGNPKMMLGLVKGCAIKLTGDDAVTAGLFVAEGIENAMTAATLGIGPVWALGSAGALESLAVLPGIEALTILADHDPTGIAAARSCGRRWADAGADVSIHYPNITGDDWNDHLADERLAS